MSFDIREFSFGFTTERPFNSIFALIDLNRDGRADILYFPNDFNATKTQVFPVGALLNDGSGRFSPAPPAFLGGATSAGATQVLVADFNRDGVEDLFVASIGWDFGGDWPGSQNRLLFGRDTGGFTDVTGNLPQLADFTESAAVGDIDGDGDLDILAMNIFGGTPSSGSLTAPYFLLNNGTGGFTRADDRLPTDVVNRLQGHKYTSVALLDANGDGRADLFLGAHGDVVQTSSILLNDGSGRFAGATAISTPPVLPTGQQTVNDALVTDLNADGRPDLILSIFVHQGATGRLQILINEGAGRFSDGTSAFLPDASSPSPPESVQMADVDGDGTRDLIVRRGTLNPVYLHDGQGQFVRLPQSFLGITDTNDRTGAADFNGDGRLDFLVERHAAFVMIQGVPAQTQTGSLQDDALLGGSLADTLIARAGADVLFGGEGADSLAGEDGDDRLVGGGGADTLLGGSGSDTLSDVSGLNYLRGEAGNDSLRGGFDFDDLHGNMGDDTVVGGGGADWVVGGQGNDRLFGDDGSDVVYGNLADDTCTGGTGDDWVRGGQGNDSISGGAGDDLLWGDRGDDTLSGGTGADTFTIFGEAGLDRVVDFNRAEGDRVRIEAGYTYTTAQVGGDVVITLSGGAQMTLVGVQLADLGPGWI